MKLTQLTGVQMASTAPITVFKGRHQYIYGVNGYGRGFRWDGASTAVEPIGINPPSSVSVTASGTTSSYKTVASVQMTTRGDGYYSPPTVTFVGAATTAATGRAALKGEGVDGVIVFGGGAGYQSPPTVVFSGGQAYGASLVPTMVGAVDSVVITNAGTGYINGATARFGPSNTPVATVYIDGANKDSVSSVNVLYGGTGFTTAATVAITGSTGASAAGSCLMQWSLAAISITSGGKGFAGKIPLTFTSLTAPALGAVAYAYANTTSGALERVEIVNPGLYYDIPTVSAIPTPASAIARLRAPMLGKYQCAIRYRDTTPESEGGPLPSNITELVEVVADNGATSFTWAWNNSNADVRADKVELFRTSADQAAVLYRVAVLSKVSGVLPTTYVDTLSDAMLVDRNRDEYMYMPITLPSGQINARRFTVPPTTMSMAVMFQDRAWYAGDTTGRNPNSLLFSEIDEPESVPDFNEIVLQENSGEQDAIIGLAPFGSMLVVAQRRHLYRVMYVSQPVIDASVTLMSHRGLLNAQCWCAMEGVLYMADSLGLYAFDGSNAEPLSVAVDDYWRNRIIDFSRSAEVFVECEPASRTVRIFYHKVGDAGSPKRALCYCVTTKAWWEESYSVGMTAGCVSTLAGQQSAIYGTSSGALHTPGTGAQDAGAASPIAFALRTGNFPVLNEPTRHVGVLYRPTEESSPLSLSVNYNGSTVASPNAVVSDRGEGFKTTTGSTAAVLDMSRTRSALADSTGYAVARYSGRFDDRSAGGDRHVSVGLDGAQVASGVALYGVTIAGVTQ